MKKFVKGLVSFVLMLLITLTSVGCGSNSGNSSETLKIRVFEGGFGTEWAKELAKGFESKYGIDTKVEASSLKNILKTEITETSKNSQKYDLFFTNLNLYADNDKFEDLSDVYAYKNENEDLTIGEKFHSSVHELYKQDDGVYRYMPWGCTEYGIVYNRNFVNDSDIPNTTDELMELCKKIKNNTDVFPFTCGGDQNYWDGMFFVWWCQYEGYEEFTNYFEGKSDGVYSTDIFKQRGRLEAYKVIEQILIPTNAYMDTKFTAITYMDAQKDFFESKSAMMINGGWLENEMSLLFPDGPSFELDIMRTPVISTIINKLDTINDDKTLSQVIDYIDGKEGSSIPEGVSEDDVNLVSEARNTNRDIYGHTAVIPKTAKHIDYAKSFLKYMYSKEGIKIFTKNSPCFLPTTNEPLDSDLFNSMSAIQKKSVSVIKPETCIAYRPNNALAWAGLPDRVRAVTEGMDSLEKIFGSQNEADRITANDLFKKEYEYYSSNNEANWKQLLKDAGIA